MRDPSEQVALEFVPSRIVRPMRDGTTIALRVKRIHSIMTHPQSLFQSYAFRVRFVAWILVGYVARRATRRGEGSI